MEKKRKNTIVVRALTVAILFVLVLSICVGWKFIIAEIQIGDPLKHSDYAGTLTIPSVGIDVPLIMVEDPDMMQMVVDKTNCAALMKKEGAGVNGQAEYSMWLIGDHSYQKFRNLSRVGVGAEAEIVRPDGSARKFVVTENFIGYNISGDLVYENGTTVWEDNTGGIILYTCVDSTSVPVYVVFLQPI